MLTRSIYSTEVEKAIKKEIKDVKPDLVYIIHFVNKLSPSVICGAKKMGVPGSAATVRLLFTVP